MTNRLKLLGGSLVGAVVIHVAIACGTGHSGAQGGAVGDAMMDVLEGPEANAAGDAGTATSCNAWQVTQIPFLTGIQPMAMPAGQEPFAVTSNSNGNTIWVRSCQ